MTPANDNNRGQANPLPLHCARLAALPMFAGDREIAVALVGKDHANKWLKETLPALEARGFPIADRMHFGRPVPLVVRFYERMWLGINKDVPAAKPDGEERLGQWRGGRKMARRAA